jgi:hypothetical protein
VLVAPGDRDYPFLLIERGFAEAVRTAAPDRPKTVISRRRRGDFAGE